MLCRRGCLRPPFPSPFSVPLFRPPFPSPFSVPLFRCPFSAALPCPALPCPALPPRHPSTALLPRSPFVTYGATFHLSCRMGRSQARYSVATLLTFIVAIIDCFANSLRRGLRFGKTPPRGVFSLPSLSCRMVVHCRNHRLLRELPTPRTSLRENATPWRFLLAHPGWRREKAGRTPDLHFATATLAAPRRGGFHIRP